MNDEAEVWVEHSDGSASVVSNRPHRKNALTGPMMDQLADAMATLSADTTVAAFVLRGEGGAFCSGVDLTELQFEPQHPWAPHFVTSGAWHLM